MREAVFSNMFSEIDMLITEEKRSPSFPRLKSNTPLKKDTCVLPKKINIKGKVEKSLGKDSLEFYVQEDSIPRYSITIETVGDSLSPDTIIAIKNNLAIFVDSTEFHDEPKHGLRTFSAAAKPSSSTAFRIGRPDIKTVDVLKRMVPQLLFSLLLFGSVLLAFVMIYRSMIKERQLSLMRNSLMSNMSHELKTPVTTIGVALEAISNFDVAGNEERRREYLDMTRQEVKRLDLLVDKTLNMSLLQKGEYQFQKEELDLEQEVKTIVKSMHLLTQSYGGEVSVDKTGISFRCKGDKTHLNNVFYNLIDNALKYNNGNPKVSIHLHEGKEKVIVSVSDNGPGIPAKYQNKVFEKLFRLPTGDVHNVKGHGLGLSYSKEVVEHLGGTISCSESNMGGAQFTVTLPKYNLA